MSVARLLRRWPPASQRQFCRGQLRALHSQCQGGAGLLVMTLVKIPLNTAAGAPSIAASPQADTCFLSGLRLPPLCPAIPCLPAGRPLAPAAAAAGRGLLQTAFWQPVARVARLTVCLSPPGPCSPTPPAAGLERVRASKALYCLAPVFTSKHYLRALQGEGRAGFARRPGPQGLQMQRSMRSITPLGPPS